MEPRLVSLSGHGFAFRRRAIAYYLLADRFFGEVIWPDNYSTGRREEINYLMGYSNLDLV